MKANFGIILLGTLFTLAPSMAHAAPGWHLSQEIGYYNGACPPGVNIGMTTRVGYFGEIAPRTGDNPDADADGTPDSAVLIKVTAGCGPVTAVPSFRLPMQVRRNMSYPIVCYRVRANGQSEVLQNTSNSVCSQTPVGNSWNLQNVYGWSYLAAGDSLEVYMPIEYISVAKPASFSAEVRHSIATNAPLFPIIQFDIDYGARFTNYTSTNMGRGRGLRWGSWDGERVDVSFELYHYFQSGNLVIEYGTTPSLGSILGTVPVPNSFEYSTVTASFTGLPQNTLYYWRPKYITPNGTFEGETQTFRTYAYLQRTPPITCPFYPCVL